MLSDNCVTESVELARAAMDVAVANYATLCNIGLGPWATEVLAAEVHTLVLYKQVYYVHDLSKLDFFIITNM